MIIDSQLLELNVLVSRVLNELSPLTGQGRSIADDFPAFYTLLQAVDALTEREHNLIAADSARRVEALLAFDAGLAEREAEG